MNKKFNSIIFDCDGVLVDSEIIALKRDMRPIKYILNIGSPSGIKLYSKVK